MQQPRGNADLDPKFFSGHLGWTIDSVVVQLSKQIGDFGLELFHVLVDQG
jgi:hypothetical protein